MSIKRTLISTIIFAIAGLTFQASAAGSWETAVSIKEVDTKPVPTVQVPPTVPAELVDQKGVIHLGFVIDTKGNVVEARVMKSTNEALNEVAVQTVSKWAFKPASNAGTATSVRAIVPIRFQ